jgi:hypothetical protein
VRPAALLVAAWQLAAQPTVAPTPSAVGPSRGRDHGGFNISNSFETGIRAHTVGGNPARYRSDVNFGNGVRLLGSRLSVNSKDGHGGLFDEILLTTQGLGNDPYESASLRVQRNGLYRYDLLWRVNDYANPGLTGGLLPGHLLNTRRQWQDHDFTLFPQSALRLFAGYSRNSQDGAGLSSLQLFDSRGDEFPLFSAVERRQAEYRIGGEASARGFKLIVLRGWQRYSDSATESVASPLAGANPNDRTTLASLRRSEPYRGDTPFWRLNLLTERKRRFGANARFSHAAGRRGHTFDELANGTDRLGSTRNRQILVAGSGRRPATSAGLTLSLFPTERVTLANHTHFSQIQMDGDLVYREINNSSQFGAVARFQHLGVRTAGNSTDASYRPARWLGLVGGYRVSTRRVSSTEGETFDNLTDKSRHEQSNRLHAGAFGARLVPVRNLTVVLDAELGRQDKPFLPTAQSDYHILGGRVQYKSRSITVGAASRANYNFNSGNLFTHSARNRSQSVDFSWTGRRGLSLDAGHNHLHADSLTGLAYFAAFRLVEGEQSLYVSNIHATHVSANWTVGGKADLALGYSRTQDTGDGRSSPTRPGGNRTATSLDAFRAVQTYPLSYHSPLVRVSVRLHPKVRWNGGYQYYGLGEDFSASQGYRAHTLYTSLLWSF